MRRRHPAAPASVLALGAVLLLSGPGAASVAPAPTPAAGTGTGTAGTTTASVAPSAVPGDAGLEVTSIMPLELRPGGRVTVRGRVTGGEDGLQDAQVEVRRAGSRSSSVSSLERWTAPLDRPPRAVDGIDDPADDARTEEVVELGDVPAGGSVPFSAVLDASDLGLRSTLRAAGPYGLQLRLVAEPGSSSGMATVDDERGFLVWSPEVDVDPTRLLTLLTLQGPPPDPATGLPDPARLLDQLRPDGRLGRLLAVAAVLDADWVVDPVLLAGAALAAGPGASAPPAPPAAPAEEDPAAPTGSGTPADGTPGEQGTGATGGTSTGTGSAGGQGPADGAATGTPTDGASRPAPAGSPPGTTAEDAAADADPAVAAAWLAALAAARDDQGVVLADWADPAPARLRSADDVDEAWATVRAAQAAALPSGLAEELLGGSTRSDVLVATEGTLTGPDLLTLAQDRTSVVLPEELVPLSDPFGLTYTPDAVTELTTAGRSFTAVLDDEALTADATAAVEGSPLAATRVLARLATTTLQRPSDPRLLALTLPAGLDPVPRAAEQLAGALAATRWAEAVPLSRALRTPPADADRDPLPTGRRVEVPGVQGLLDALADAREVQAAVAVPTDPVQAAALDLRAAATLSRRAAPGAAAGLAAAVSELTRATVDAVQIVPGSRVTLVAEEAELPVTVVSTLGAEVDLVLEVRSRSPRLQVPSTQVPVTVRPGQRAVVDVPVVAVASGATEVTSQLTTADGRPWGPPSTIPVTVATQAEDRVLTGVGVGVAVLFVLGAVRAVVRDRRGRELVGAGPVEP